jgi:hypothetical protein
VGRAFNRVGPGRQHMEYGRARMAGSRFLSRVGRLDQRMLARTKCPQPVEGDMARLARARLLTLLGH